MANIPGPGGGGGGANAVATGIIVIRADFRQFNTQMNQFNTVIINKMTISGNRAGRGFGRSFADAFRRQMRTLRTDLHHLLTGKLATTLTGAAFGGLAFAGWGVKMAGEMEQAEVSMQSLARSMTKGTKVFNEVRQFARDTPFEFPELRDAARLLMAYGVSANQVVPTLKRLGDMAGATGASVFELAEVYGRFKTQGRVYAQDVRELTRLGVPLKETLAKQFNTDTEGVTQLIKKGKVGFAEVDAAIRSMTDSGGLFFGMTERLSTTMIGQFNKMHDAVRDVAIQIGEGLRPAVETVTQVLMAMLPHLEKPLRAFATEFTPDRIFAWSEAAAHAVNQVVGVVELLTAAFAEARAGWLLLMIEIAEKINQANHFFAKMMPGGRDAKQLDASDEFLATLKREAAPYLFDSLARDKNGAFMMNPDGSFKRRMQHAGEATTERGNTISEFFGNARKSLREFQEKKSSNTVQKDTWVEKLRSAMGSFASTVAGRATGTAEAMGMGLATAGMGMIARMFGEKELKREKKDSVLDGGFTSFEELNRNIQSALLKDSVQKKIEKNTAETNQLLGGVGEKLGKMVFNTSAFSVFGP